MQSFPFLRRRIPALSIIDRTLLLLTVLSITKPVAALDPTLPEVTSAYAGPATATKLDAALRGFEELLEALRSRPSGPASFGVVISESIVGPGTISAPFITVLSTLSAISDADLGAPADPLVLDRAQLNVLGSFASSRVVTIGAGGAIIDTGSFTLALDGNLTAAGVLLKQGTGVLKLNGTNSWSAIPFVAEGTLRGNTVSLATDIHAESVFPAEGPAPTVEFHRLQ